MIMTAGETVRVEDLPLDIRGDASGASPQSVVAPAGVQAAADAVAPQAETPSGASFVAAPRPTGTLREFKDAAERAYLVQRLRENHWNISKTAEAIDTPRSNLYKKLEQYGIKQDRDG